MSTKAYNAAYYMAHREEKRAYLAAYRATHKKEQAALAKAWYAAHRQLSIERAVAWNQAHPWERFVSLAASQLKQLEGRSTNAS